VESLNTLKPPVLETNNLFIKEGAVNIVADQTLCNRTIDSPEARLILACSQTRINASTATLIKELLQEELDWEYIIKNAQTNGVTPLLCHNLLHTHPELIPERFLHWLLGFSREHARNNLLQTMELLKVIQLLEDNNVPALPLKGPTLAALVYGNVALRQFCDLDILVHKKNIDRAINILATHGYHLTALPSWFERLPTPISRKKDVSLANDNGSVRIELHWRLSGTHFDLPLGNEALWTSLEKASLAGTSVRTLPVNDLLLYLTMHGSRHGWARLAWICDVAEIVGIHKDLDWSALMRRAAALGSERNLALGLLLANSVLGAEMPSDIVKRIQTDSKLGALSAQIHHRLFTDIENSLDISYWHDYHLRVRERLRDRVRLRLHYYTRYFRLVTTPTEQDRIFLLLPIFLSFLYYLIRPFRLIKVHGFNRLVRILKRFRQKNKETDVPLKH
jgi:hypothetical protein